MLPNPEEAFSVPSIGIVVETNVEAGMTLSLHSIDSSTAWRASAMSKGEFNRRRMLMLLFMYEEHVSIERLWAFVRAEKNWTGMSSATWINAAIACAL